jgi:hypothetical protein
MTFTVAGLKTLSISSQKNQYYQAQLKQSKTKDPEALNLG